MHPAAIKRPASLSFAKLFNIKDLDWTTLIQGLAVTMKQSKKWRMKRFVQFHESTAWETLAWKTRTWHISQFSLWPNTKPQKLTHQGWRIIAHDFFQIYSDNIHGQSYSAQQLHFTIIAQSFHWYWCLHQLLSFFMIGQDELNIDLFCKFVSSVLWESISE